MPSWILEGDTASCTTYRRTSGSILQVRPTRPGAHPQTELPSVQGRGDMKSRNWEILHWLLGCQEGLGIGWAVLSKDMQEECVSWPSPSLRGRDPFNCPATTLPRAASGSYSRQLAQAPTADTMWCHPLARDNEAEGLGYKRVFPLSRALFPLSWPNHGLGNDQTYLHVDGLNHLGAVIYALCMPIFLLAKLLLPSPGPGT